MVSVSYSLSSLYSLSTLLTGEKSRKSTSRSIRFLNVPALNGRFQTFPARPTPACKHHHHFPPVTAALNFAQSARLYGLTGFFFFSKNG